MRILTPKHWEDFKETRANGKRYFNGIRFEELIREILRIYFDGIWEPTSISWDGGKDFVDKSIAGKQSWAECKMYEKTLSVKVISNTLVMAINKENVHDIIIFSYSPLNQNAVCHLSSFSSATKINVQVFDDLRLEALILGNTLLVRKYFKVKGLAIQNAFKEKVETRSLFTTDTSIEYSQIAGIDGISKSRTPLISINTTCLYEIFLRSNEITKSSKITVDISKINSIGEGLEILNIKYLGFDRKGLTKKTLLPGQVYSIKLYVSPKSQAVREIPSIEIKSSGEVKMLPAIKIRISNLNRPSLIGGIMDEALRNFESIVSSTNTISSFIVSGKSGVGKSRFLEEAELRLLSHNYIVLHIDGHSNLARNFNTFSSNLLSQIWRLPNVYLLNDNEDEITSSNTSDTVFDRVYAILLDLAKTENLSENKLNEVFDLICEGLLRQNIALLIDNTQSLDNQSLQIINKLLRNTTGTIGLNRFVFAFNEDELIYSQEATLLYQELKKSAVYRGRGALILIQLPEFNENYVRMFLNTICVTMDNKVSFTEHYPELTRLICENVLPRPLDLYQLFLAAQDELNKSASIENGFFFVNDIERFYELVQNVSGKTEKIFEMRLLNLSNNINNLKTLLALSCFGETDFSIFSSITEIKETHIQELVDSGWIKHIGGNRIAFFHPSIERYVIKNINNQNNSLARLFSSNVRKDLFNSLEKSDYSKSYKLARFFLSPTKPIEIVRAALDEIKTLGNSVPSARNRLYSQAILSYLLKSDKLSPSYYLSCIIILCKFASEGRISDLKDRLLTIRNHLHSFIPSTDQEAFLFFQIIRQYASYSSMMGHPDLGDEKLQGEIMLISKLPNTVSELTKKRLTVNLLNRRCVCLKDWGKLDEAENVGMSALSLAKENDFKDYICLSLIDLSAVFKSEKKYEKRYLSYLEQAISYFKENKDIIDDSSIELSCWENEARLYGLAGKTTEVIKLTEKVIKVAREKNDVYYLLRGLSIKAIFLLQNELSKRRANRNSISLIKNLINEFEDLAIVSRLDKFYLKALHLQAIISSVTNDKNKSESFYLAALTKVEQRFSSPGSIKYIAYSDKALILDALNFWKTNLNSKNFPVSKSILEGINVRNPSKIHKANMLFALGNFNYPFP